MDVDDRYIFEIQRDIAFLSKQKRPITLFQPDYIWTSARVKERR